MKTTFGKLLSGLLAAVTVLCMTVLATVGVCAADCAGGKHAMRYSVVSGELTMPARIAAQTMRQRRKKPTAVPFFISGE